MLHMGGGRWWCLVVPSGAQTAAMFSILSNSASAFELDHDCGWVRAAFTFSHFVKDDHGRGYTLFQAK